MTELLQILAGICFIIIMAIFVYTGCHIQEEKHQGKTIPLMWEKGGRFAKYFGHDSKKDGE